MKSSEGMAESLQIIPISSHQLEATRPQTATGMGLRAVTHAANQSSPPTDPQIACILAPVASDKEQLSSLTWSHLYHPPFCQEQQAPLDRKSVV